MTPKFIKYFHAHTKTKSPYANIIQVVRVLNMTMPKLELTNHPVSLSQVIAHGMSQVIAGTDIAQ
jgi:hypothetical protein